METIGIFRDVVQHQSFSRGAAANGVSQSVFRPTAAKFIELVNEFEGGGES